MEYIHKVEPSTLVTARIGSTYTASCYVNLYSLLQTKQPVGATILLYSYGSGSSSAMYRLRVHAMPQLVVNITDMLDQRQEHGVISYLSTGERYSGMYGQFDVICPPLSVVRTMEQVSVVFEQCR